jgi:hypothetical protein
MTEEEWLTCTDPQKMLKSLGDNARDRKLRLFACGCCRLIWPLLTDLRSRELLGVTERAADGLADTEEWQEAKRRHQHVYVGAAFAVTAAAQISGRLAAESMLISLRESLLRAGRWRLCKPEVVLRDIFGNPFRSVSLDATWLTWNGGTVPLLAQTIYDDGRFQDLPILADALEEAGCTNADILDHCRRPGEHVRGCWVIDLLLGKK